MANHLTPEELAKETGIDRDEVIRICVEEGVPIYHGKIDKTLFQATLEAVGTTASRFAVLAELGGFRAAARLRLRAGRLLRFCRPLLRRCDAGLQAPP